MGDVIGYSHFYDANGTVHEQGFLFSDGNIVNIPLPSGAGTNVKVIPNAINDLGVVVGENRYGSKGETAFYFQKGVMTTLGTLPGYSYSHTADINNHGQIVGSVHNEKNYIAADNRPFLYENEEMKLIPLPEFAYQGAATGINNHGQIVGTLLQQGMKAQIFMVGAFLYSGGETVRLDTLPEVIAAGIEITQAKAINDKGQILVETDNISTPTYYLLSPMQ